MRTLGFAPSAGNLQVCTRIGSRRVVARARASRARELSLAPTVVASGCHASAAPMASSPPRVRSTGGGAQQQVVSARASSPLRRAPSPVAAAGPAIGPVFAVGDKVTKKWKWPSENPGGTSRSELIGKWMEATCLQCSVDRNHSSEAVWDVSCGTGFGLDFEFHRLPSAGELDITATVSSVQQRQVTFSVVAADSAGALVADGRHMRAYPTHGEMEAKLTRKLERWRTLKPGLTGWFTAAVAEEHTGGSRDVAWSEGAAGDAASTSAILNWMVQAAVAACDAAIPGQQRLVAGESRWESIPGRSTVSHIAPTPLGMTVLAKAKLMSVERQSMESREAGRKGDEEGGWEGTVLTFALSAEDNSEDHVATGTHTRIITWVDSDTYGGSTEPSGPMTPSRGGR